MIRCPECDVSAPPDSRFCPECGQKLHQPCPSCAQDVGVWMTFCPYCGGRMGEAPQHGSERSLKLATVLFGDVKGFTAMSEDLPPEEVTDIMNECFEELSKPILQYGGTIDKYVGDAIMARFGAPQAHEDDPVRAIHASLEMQRLLTRFAEKLKATRGFDLAMRIGINTGQVLAGEVGSAALKQFTLMGNTVNLASRLEHEAEPGSVLVGETTYKLARHAFEFKVMPPMEIRGQSELVNSYVPLRPKLGKPELKGGGKLRLVGRDAELAQLDTYLQEAREGQGRLVALVGDPGLGKSRLVEEFWKRHLGRGVTRVYAAAPSFGESMPYSLLSAFSRSLLFGEAADHEIGGEHLRERLTSLLPAPAVDDAVALLDDFLGIEGWESTEVAQLEGRSRQAMLTNILKMILAVRSQQGPLLLTLEDMQWADSSSLDVFEQILTGIQNLPIMALITHRPRFSSGWSSMACYRQVSVRELTSTDARELLTEFFGSNAIPAAIGERVIETAGGNPFFLEQLLNNLVQTGAIVQEHGIWELAGDIRTLSVPDTIQEILQARIDQLPRGSRSSLEVAAVIGRVFLRRLLEAVVETERNLDDHLQQLLRQEFIFEKSILPEVEYMFTHALTQDVVYHGMPEARRRALHERVADAIERLGIATTGEQVPLLAVHYEKTANHEKALEYALAAARRARELYANQEAADHFHKVLELLNEEPAGASISKLAVLEELGDLHSLLAEFDTACDYYEQARAETVTPSDRARLLRKLGSLAEARGKTGDALTTYREAEEQLREVDDPAEQINVWLAMARLDRSRGALESASTVCLRALSLADQVDERTSASLYFELGEIERERGRFRSASGYLEAAESVWDEMGAREKQALVFSALADVSFNRGELEEALTYYERALETQERVLDRQGMASTLAGIGRIRLAAGDLDAAAECYGKALAIAEEIDHKLLAAGCRLQLGNVYLDRAEVDRAGELILGTEEQKYKDGVSPRFKQLRNWRGVAQSRVAESRLARARGDIDHARTILRKAWNLANEMNDPWIKAEISVREAELEEEAGRLDRGAERAQAGINIARDLSDALLVGRGERVLGRIRARQGRRGEALSLLQSSVETLRRSGSLLPAARASLDYAVAANGLTGTVEQTAHELLVFALQTFEHAGSQRDLRIAQSIARQSSLDPKEAVGR